MTRKTALILGATGGIGGSIAEALLRKGWSVRALARDPIKAATSWGRRVQGIQWVSGDAMSRDDVVAAAAGVAAIVHAVNPPGYRNWEVVVLPMIDNTIAAAQAAGGARIVLPGTIYNYDPARASIIDENTPQQSRTRKGMIRAELERRLKAASSVAPVLILRAGDFFGPEIRANWFAQSLVKPGGTVRNLLNPGEGVGHSWAYLPDLAQTFAALMDREEALRPFEVVQFEGLWDADGSALPAAIRTAVGRDVPERAFPWWLMRLLAPFGGFPREVVEIEPFWRNPVRFDNVRLVQILGCEPRTPLAEAVHATLVAQGNLEAPTVLQAQPA